MADKLLILPTARGAYAFVWQARKDFVSLGKTLKIPDKAIENAFSRLLEALPSALGQLERSPLPRDLREEFTGFIQDRLKRVT